MIAPDWCLSQSTVTLLCNVTDPGPSFSKRIITNVRLKINQGVNFSTPKCYLTQIFFGKTLH